MKQFLPVMIALLCAACQQKNGTTTGSVQDSTVQPVPEPAAAVTVSNSNDTVTIGSRLFGFTDVAQSEFDAIPGLEPDTSETVNLSRVPGGRVQRSGDSLIFSLENGGKKVLVNNHHDGDDYAQYQFLGYMPELQRWLVLNTGYEWYTYELLDVHSGESVHTIGIPQFSPDKKYFLSSNADLVAQFTTNGFELFEIRKEGPVEIQNYQPEKWGPVKIKWKDANTLYGEIIEVNGQLDATTRFVKFFLQ